MNQNKKMAYINALQCYRQQKQPQQITFTNNLVETMSNLIIRLLLYACILSILLNINCDRIAVQASYSEADDLLNELDRPSKYIWKLYFDYIIYFYQFKIELKTFQSFTVAKKEDFNTVFRFEFDYILCFFFEKINPLGQNSFYLKQ